MEHTLESSEPGRAPPRAFGSADRLALPTILIVEDDPDIREMMSTLLDLAGFACVECDSAEAGLASLREQTVDLILTDYALPKNTGSWLLERAEAEGLIQGTPVMVVTAHPNPIGVSTYEIVQKPFDLDDLLSRVKRRMGESGERRRQAASARSSRNGGSRDRQRDPDCPGPVELILYVSSHSLGSAAAIRTVQKVLARFDAERVKLTVWDLSLDPAKGAEHRAALTPTPVRKSPTPRTCILGHITNPELMLELLNDCELEQR